MGDGWGWENMRDGGKNRETLTREQIFTKKFVKNFCRDFDRKARQNFASQNSQNFCSRFLPRFTIKNRENRD